MERQVFFYLKLSTVLVHTKKLKVWSGKLKAIVRKIKKQGWEVMAANLSGLNILTQNMKGTIKARRMKQKIAISAMTGKEF